MGNGKWGELPCPSPIFHSPQFHCSAIDSKPCPALCYEAQLEVLSDLFRITNFVSSFAPQHETYHGQTHIPPPQYAPSSEAWLPCAHGDEMGARSALAPSQEGTQGVDGCHSEQVQHCRITYRPGRSRKTHRPRLYLRRLYRRTLYRRLTTSHARSPKARSHFREHLA